MSKKIISVALLAATALSTGAYAQSYQGGSDSSSQQQYQDSSTSAQYYDYQGKQSNSPSYSQQQNGQYVDHTGLDTGTNQANPYARDLKDGPMGTSPGA